MKGVDDIEIFKLFGSIGIKNQDANKAIDETTGKAEGASGKIGAIFGKLAGVLGALFAGKAIFDFGKSTVEAAATAQAMKAQFSAVFGKLAPEAKSTVDKMAKEMGILPNRLNPLFTSLTSKYKGLGASSEEAMQLASKGSHIAADAAAFYDKSLEETSGALNSFINGNYEGGESIGLFANETQIASWASKNLGLDWDSLDEKGKQIARMGYAEAMQKAAGATGQAARESDGYENVMGNLKQAWEDFKATVGGPLLQPVVSGIKIAVQWFQTAQDWLGKLKKELKENGAVQSFKNTLDNVSTAIQNITGLLPQMNAPNAKQMAGDFADIASKIEDASKFVKDLTQSIAELDFGALTEKFAPLIAGVGAMATAWGIYSLALGIKSAAETVAIISMYAMDVAAATLGATMAFLMSPITLIIIGIGLLVAAGVWLWQNWDSVSKWAVTAWEAIKTTIWNVLLALAKITIDTWNSIKTSMSNAWENIKNTLRDILVAIGKIMVDTWNNIKNTVSNVVNSIKTTLANTWNSIKSTVSSVWNSIASTISGAIDKAKNAVQSGIDKMKSMFNFKWSLPHISLPHFSVSGGEAPWGFMGKGSLPSVGVDWYAKGGIMTDPTLFGMNGNRAMVGGEAGPEAVLPLNSKTLGQIGQGINDASDSELTSIAEMLQSIIELLAMIYEKDIDVILDGDSLVAKTWRKIQDQIEFSNNRNKRYGG